MAAREYRSVLRFHWMLALMLMFPLVACSRRGGSVDAPQREPFEVQVSVVSDPGEGIEGAEILSGSKMLGKTDPTGVARVRIRGNDGDQVALTVKCPPSYEAPATPLSIPLRRLAPGSRPPQFQARCAPSLRTVVVGIRATGGPNLPVTYLGRTMARTDASGAAVFVMRVKPADQIEITLSTDEPDAQALRPRNPTLTFVAKDADDFIVLDQAFTAKKKPVHVAPPPPRPRPL